MGQFNNDRRSDSDSEKRMTRLESCLVEAIVQAEDLRIRNRLPQSGRALEQLLNTIQLHR